MKKIAVICWLVSAPAAMLLAFQISGEVAGLEQELKAVQREILRDQEAIHVLQAEWSYLNQPAKIADMAARHLQFEPLLAAQYVAFEDLPLRQEGVDHAVGVAQASLVGAGATP